MRLSLHFVALRGDSGVARAFQRVRFIRELVSVFTRWKACATLVAATQAIVIALISASSAHAVEEVNARADEQEPDERHTEPDELARNNEVHIHQRLWL
jgi:hypothetical protein